MFDPSRLAKLKDHLQQLVGQLEKHPDLIIHQRINQFYYMEQVEELMMLVEQSEAAYKRAQMFSRWMEASYAAAYKKWRKDVRWLTQHLLQQQRPKSIL